MKIRTDFVDGLFHAEPYTDEHAKHGLAFVEMTDEDWREFEDFQVQAIRWQELLCDLDAKQFKLDHPELIEP